MQRLSAARQRVVHRCRSRLVSEAVDPELAVLLAVGEAWNSSRLCALRLLLARLAVALAAMEQAPALVEVAEHG